MDHRLKEIKNWLTDTLSLDITSIEPASQDASFRRYFRVDCKTQQYGRNNSLIVMDAPPEHESLIEFIAVDCALIANQIHAPTIYASHLEKGFLLLEDLGNKTYLDHLQENSIQLYDDALDALIATQSIKRNALGQFDIECKQSIDDSIKKYTPPAYDIALINQELELFITWYCEKHLNITLSNEQKSIWNDLKRQLILVFEEQPQTWVHRDYHSRNLMVTKTKSPGIIDFQDMVWGPISYDLASIFKDCYIEWPRETQIDWLQTYLEKLSIKNSNTNITLEQLVKWFDLTALQRHIKVLGIFCRLNYRDGKNHYLLDLPLVEKYITEVLDIYPSLDKFKKLFKVIRTNDT